MENTAWPGNEWASLDFGSSSKPWGNSPEPNHMQPDATGVSTPPREPQQSSLCILTWVRKAGLVLIWANQTEREREEEGTLPQVISFSTSYQFYKSLLIWEEWVGEGLTFFLTALALGCGMAFSLWKWWQLLTQPSLSCKWHFVSPCPSWMWAFRDSNLVLFISILRI